MSSFLVTEEKKQEQLILLIDKQNRFGNLLADRLTSQATVVLVSEKENPNPSVIHVPFKTDTAHIPDGSYSHIIFIWDHEKESLDLLQSLLQKAYETSAKFLFVCDYHFYSESLLEKIRKDGVASSCVLTGDIYDLPTPDQYIAVLFHQAKEESRITLSQMGLEPVHLVTLEQTIQGILRIALGASRIKLAFAFSEHSQTLLAVSHALQQVEPLLKVDFLEQEGSHAIQVLPQGEYLMHEPTNMKDIQQAFQKYLTQPHAKKKNILAQASQVAVPAFLTAAQPALSQTYQRKKKRKKLPVVILIIFLLLLPIIIPLILAGVGVLLLSQIKTTALQGQLERSKQEAQAAKEFFSVAQETDPALLLLANTAHREDLAQTFSVNVHNGLFLADGVSHLFAAGNDYQQISSGKAMFPDVTFTQGVNELQSGLLALQQLNTASPYTREKATLQKLQQVTPVISDMLPILPQVMGMQKKQTYLILFQNNMELRPSGGFIGSYGIVTFDKGKIGQLAVHNVYDADGQLKGHVEPPFAIRRYIPLVHWYLRDSGFDVDFSKSAAQAAYFLKQETGQQVDGVVAIDLSFVQSLIQAVGSVSVPQYNQTVTPENFFLLTESHAEKNSFAGSTQKQDFLQTLFNTLQQKLTSNHISLLSLLQSTQEALQEKHLLITMADPSVQDVFTVNGFSSALWDNRTSAPNTLLDFTGINEANLGVNKVNYYVHRIVDQQMTIHSSGTVSGALTITYTNSSDGKWPGGDYKNYLRFILPQDAVLRSVTIDGKDERLQAAITNPAQYEAKSFTPPIGLEVERAQESGRVLYGFLVSVGHGQSRQVHITYDLHQAFDMRQGSFTYSQLLFKQPGMFSYPYTFSVVYPQDVVPTQIPAGFTKTAQGITRQFSFGKDTTITVPFSTQ